MAPSDFPFFDHHPKTVYLDSAATTLPCRSVVACVSETLSSSYAPVGRGLYPSSIAATEHYEAARTRVATFLGSPEGHVIVTAGATDSLNLLASGLRHAIETGDEIVVSEAEHHANLLPWQRLAEETGAVLKTIPIHESGQINAEHIREVCSDRTRIVSLSLVSNVFGTVLDAPSIRAVLNEQGRHAWLFLDASQAAAHIPINASALGADAIVFAGHKVYGPSGIGILWGTASLLEELEPLRLGGGMVDSVTTTEASYLALPARLEAGSPNLEGLLGLAAALDYIEASSEDTHLAEKLREVIEAITGLHILGDPDPRSGIVSFYHDTIHPHDIAGFLAERDICVRAGHHCAQPLHRALGIGGSVRVSLGRYNVEADLEALSGALRELLERYA